MTKQTNWKTYEEVARYLLDIFAAEFKLETVEGKQKVQGFKTGTEWEIDAKGIEEDTGGMFIVECRRYTTSRLSQEHLGGLAFRIIDTESSGGIIVSPLPLQHGAELVAEASNIIVVQITPESTPQNFAINFLEKFKAGGGMSLFI